VAQSLDLLNSDLMLEWSRALAGRVFSQAGKTAETSEQVNQAYRLVYGRGASGEEFKTAAAFLDRQTPILAKRLAGTSRPPLPATIAEGMDPARAAAFVDLCQALLASNEFLYIN